MNNELKEYNFKYSKSLLGFESIFVLATFVLAGYLYFEKNSVRLAIILLVIGILNSIYYISRITNNKVQLKINNKGITLKNRFFSWNQINHINIDKVSTGKTSVEFLSLTTKADKDFEIEISELNVSGKKLKEIIKNYKNIS
ncbi:hypothetical protein ACFOWU_03230 [Epilithonimonas zeae]|uniref:Uncharacterized protein n=1 Tax=Epilithonimonas zeae TaxID=1416779 RepID=A0A1N6EKA0_9FLAO|nr:hypothetical protein [Epilithonimonas zeae]SIN83351.1 hypothetical protein SAMN05444409_0683 [Epilithonimonas zeae]